jgi:hypothetical protein
MAQVVNSTETVVPRSCERWSWPLALFKAGARIQIGNGQRARFWQLTGLQEGVRCRMCFPLFSVTSGIRHLHGGGVNQHGWARDIRGGLCTQAIAQYLQLWDLVERTVVNTKEDEVIWQCKATRKFSISSTYMPSSSSPTQGSFAPSPYGNQRPPWNVSSSCGGWPHNPLTCALEYLKETQRTKFPTRVQCPGRVIEITIEDLRSWRAAGCVTAFKLLEGVKCLWPYSMKGPFVRSRIESQQAYTRI